MAPKFSLQTVLDVRHSRVESLEIELGALLQERQKMEDERDALIQAQQKLFEEFHARMTGDMDLFIINHLRSNINFLSDRITRCHEQIDALTAQVEDKRSELVSAKQAEESLNILKSKEYQRYLDEETEKEKRQQDDLYISRSFRNRKNEAYPS